MFTTDVLYQYYFKSPRSTISYKIFETNSSFHENLGHHGKSLIATFLLVLAKFLFWQGPWILGYHSMKFRHFPNIF